MVNNLNLGSQIQQIIDSCKSNVPDMSSSARVKRAWNMTADPRVADHVTAVFVVPNTNASEIIVYVDDAIWATELSLQSEMLRLKLNMQLNEEAQREDQPINQVEKILFKVSKDEYIAKERKVSVSQQLEEENANLKNVIPIELSEDEESVLYTALAGVENDDLRDIAYAAAKASLEWQKGREKIGA